jgi:hypothetical protein
VRMHVCLLEGLACELVLRFEARIVCALWMSAPANALLLCCSFDSLLCNALLVANILSTYYLWLTVLECAL